MILKVEGILDISYLNRFSTAAKCVLEDYKVPGPGNYPAIDTKTIYFKNPSFKIGKSNRSFYEKANNITGPGDYNIKIGKGLSYSMVSRKEALNSSLGIPGPGYYNPKENQVFEKSRISGMGVGNRMIMSNKNSSPSPAQYIIKSKQISPKTKLNQ